MIFKIKTEKQREAVISYINRLPIEKRGFRGRIDPITDKRSDRQNRYMHFVFTLIADEAGEDMTDVKWFYREKYLKEFIEVFGEEIEIIRSTTELDTIKQEDFMSKVRIHASAERSIFVPLPNEITYEDEITR